MEKPIAVFLQAGAAYMFVAAGIFGGDAVLLIAPAVVSGVAGLLLWGKASRNTLKAPDEPVQRDGHQLDRVQDALASLQQDVRHLREDREFMRELYAVNKTTPHRIAKE